MSEMTITMAGINVGKSMFSQQAIDRLMRDLNCHPISELVLNTGTVYGSRYYTVEPIGGNWWEMECWVGETFGVSEGSIWADTNRPAPQPAERWYANNRKFWFRTEKDRDWFVMRWSSAT
jgi:hypothetical protein